MIHNETYKESSISYLEAFNTNQKLVDQETYEQVASITEQYVDKNTFNITWLVCELAFREILSDEKIEQAD